MSGADIIAESMYHESEARRNIRDIDEEQAREGVLRELFGEWDEGSLPGSLERFDEDEDDRTTFEDVAEGIYDELLELLVERQAKYGATNIEQQGLYGVLVRIRDDKISRIQRALNGRIEHGRVVLDGIDMTGEEGDTLEDAYKDLANYAVISLMILRHQWGYPLRAET